MSKIGLIPKRKLDEITLPNTSPYYTDVIEKKVAVNYSVADSDLTTHADDTSTHGVTVAVVGTTDIQTLTNKTLTSPTINGTVATTSLTLPAITLSGAVTAYVGSNIVRSATKVVAANDADATVKLQADYVCDGTADDVQIQAAWDSLTNPGSVLLSAGTFTLAASLDRKNKGNSLIGQGRYATTLTLANSVNDSVIKDIVNNTTGGYIGHLGIDGNSANQTAGHGISLRSAFDLTIDDVWITDCKQHGIYVRGHGRNIIQNSWIRLNRGVGIFVDDEVDGLQINNNFIGDNGAVGTFAAVSGATVTTEANVLLTGASAVTMTGNFIWQPYYTGTGVAGVNVVINASFTVTITGGEIYSSSGENILIGGWAGGAYTNTVAISGVLFSAASTYDGSRYHVYIGDAGQANYVEARNVSIVGCTFEQSSATAVAGAVSEAVASSNNSVFCNNVKWQNATAPTISMVGTTSRAGLNHGWTTENSGTGTINSGTTSATITHSCSYTPTAKDITVTLTENPTNTPGAIWVDTINSTQLNVNCENDPGTSNLDFSWAVRRI